MNATRLGLGLAVLAVVVTALVPTCSSETREVPPSAPSSAAPRPRVGPRRSTERRAAAADARPAVEALPTTERPSSGESPIPAASGVAVRVTRDGRPVEGAHVWLRSLSQGETAPDVPRTQWTDFAYFGAPRTLGFADDFDSAPNADMVRARLGESVRTGPDGVAVLLARSGECAVVVASADGPSLVRDAPVVKAVAGASVEVALESRAPSTIAGRCLSEEGVAVAGAMVQAFDAERAASALVRTDAAGAFALLVDGTRPRFRVRVAAPRQLPMCDTEAALPPTLEDALVADVAPDAAPLEIRLRRAPSVVLELTSDVPFNDLQVEELVLDASAQVWGRLGGPVYRRAAAAADPRHAFVALSRADAQRPLMLWTWGGPPELTGVDPRGRARCAVRLKRGRKTSVTGKGWLQGDRVRVVCFIGPPGEEFPGVWVENGVDEGATWSRVDTPPCEVEFRLVRDGREIGPRPRVPAGGEDASVRIDL